MGRRPRAAPDDEIGTVSLPLQLLDVITAHRLGGVEAMLLVHLVRRWIDEESVGGATVVRLETGMAASLPSEPTGGRI